MQQKIAKETNKSKTTRIHLHKIHLKPKNINNSPALKILLQYYKTTIQSIQTTNQTITSSRHSRIQHTHIIPLN